MKSNGFEVSKHVTMKQSKGLKRLRARQSAKTTPNKIVRLEKVSMPFFDGTVRQYPQFKQDFQKQVMPTVSKDSACYVLRLCLGNEPTDAIRGVCDDIQEMWKRLDERYRDPA